jgi:DNA topoisomerase-1
MAKNLVIVESPAKAKTIEKYLGKDFSVKSSFGHVRDLPKKGLNIDIEHNFAPTYEISPDKTKVISELKKAAKGAEVWLASDEDREGEAIAWHLCEALKLDPKKTKRIVFHEITKPAIENAVKNPRTVDLKLVDAQQARRILDRLVGYELSPILWKKVKTGLSAGRVQSVAVRLIVEREREINDHAAESSYKVTAEFVSGKDTVPAELKDKLADQKTAKKFLEDCKGAIFTVQSIDQKPGSRNPSAPFTTSTLQQEASRKIGNSVRQTMRLAQTLYENGHITYMRTDSTNLSGLAIKSFGDYIEKQYGKNYHQVRQYKTKSAGAQEAHEAIRPTDVNKLSAGSTPQEERLYKLIWQRAIASQMAPAQTERTEATITISSRKEIFVAKGEVLKFDGFLKVYDNTQKDTILPPLTEGQTLTANEILASQVFTKPSARYSEAALVKKLEELGIGRPSTYAPTISTIQDRGYVEKADVEGEEREITVLKLVKNTVTEEQTKQVFGKDQNKLLPTPTAEVTTDFLMKYFADILDYDFTADAEKKFDNVEEGEEAWQTVIERFYKLFHPMINNAEGATRQEASQARELGIDPKSKEPVLARFGKYGPMLQIGNPDPEDKEAPKPKFAPLPEGKTLMTVTLEEALKMFELPRVVGKTKEGEEITANIGRFGPYIQVGKLFVSIKPMSPFEVTEKEARELYEEKKKGEAKKHIKEFDSGIKVLNGMYGPYITDGKKNAKIPKDVKPKDITEEQAKKMLEEAPEKGKGRFRRKATK